MNASAGTRGDVVGSRKGSSSGRGTLEKYWNKSGQFSKEKIIELRCICIMVMDKVSITFEFMLTLS